MKFSAFTVIAAVAALAQVSAAPAPIRLLVVSSSVEEDSPLNGLRFGHAVPAIPSYRNDLLTSPPPPGLPAANIDLSPLDGKDMPPSPDGNHVPPKHLRHRPGCHKGKVAIFMHKMKIKAIKIGNCFRKALGWPLIEVKHHRHHHHHHHHDHPPHHSKPGKDSQKDEDILVDGGFVNIFGDSDSSQGHESQQKEHKFHSSFFSRLHHSLMNLGQWEGRAVAFVIGCGIGVLVRMFWVLGIVSYRACRGHREDGYIVGVLEEYDSDDENISLPSAKAEPPKYVYPVDEKAVVVETN